MKMVKLLLSLACLCTAWLRAQDAKVTPTDSKDLQDFPGKEGQMILDEYRPGASEPVHSHNAQQSR